MLAYHTTLPRKKSLQFSTDKLHSFVVTLKRTEDIFCSAFYSKLIRFFFAHSQLNLINRRPLFFSSVREIKTRLKTLFQLRCAIKTYVLIMRSESVITVCAPPDICAPSRTSFAHHLGHLLRTIPDKMQRRQNSSSSSSSLGPVNRSVRGACSYAEARLKRLSSITSQIKK